MLQSEIINLHTTPSHTTAIHVISDWVGFGYMCKNKMIFIGNYLHLNKKLINSLPSWLISFAFTVYCNYGVIRIFNLCLTLIHLYNSCMICCVSDYSQLWQMNMSCGEWLQVLSQEIKLNARAADNAIKWIADDLFP